MSERSQLRQEMWAEQGGACCYCGALTVLKPRNRARPPNLATLDHVTPVSRGGRTERGNVVIACRTCNDRKADGMPGFTVTALRRLGRRIPRRLIAEPSPPQPTQRHVRHHHANPGPVRPIGARVR